LCDVIVGVPSSFGLTRVTHLYYRSSFMFVTRRGRAVHVRSLDDSRLRRLRIGIEITGETMRTRRRRRRWRRGTSRITSAATWSTATTSG
jgi:hypothetical protein